MAIDLINGWIHVMGGEGQMPEVNEDGHSKTLLMSFSNFPGMMLGEYRADETGGAFYNLSDEPLAKLGIFVNAWHSLPEEYFEEEDNG